MHKHSELEGYHLVRNRERRVTVRPKKYGIVVLISYAFMVIDDVSGWELISYKKAMSSKEKSKWLAAIKEKIASFKKNNT